MFPWYSWSVLWLYFCIKINWKNPNFRDKIENIPLIIFDLIEATSFFIVAFLWPWPNPTAKTGETRSQKVIELRSRRTKITQVERPPPPDEGA